MAKKPIDFFISLRNYVCDERKLQIAMAARNKNFTEYFHEIEWFSNVMHPFTRYRNRISMQVCIIYFQKKKKWHVILVLRSGRETANDAYFLLVLFYGLCKNWIHISNDIKAVYFFLCILFAHTQRHTSDAIHASIVYTMLSIDIEVLPRIRQCNRNKSMKRTR